MLSTGTWGQFCFLLPCWSTSPVMSPPVSKSSLLLVPATICTQSLLSTSYPCFANCGCFSAFLSNASFSPNFSASHGGLLIQHKSLLTHLYLFLKTLFLKSKMRERRKRKGERKNKRERGDNFLHFPAHVSNCLSSL